MNGRLYKEAISIQQSAKRFTAEDAKDAKKQNPEEQDQVSA